MANALNSQHTTTFPDLLNQAKASIAVSTYQAGKLILLRSNGESLNTHFVSLPKPMGVALNKGRLSIGSSANVIDYFNLVNVAPKIKPLNTHDAAFLPRRTHNTGDIDIHEMAFDGDNELWVVNTKMSCLCTIDVRHSFVPRWRPPFVTGYDLTDRCHLNGLAMRDGKPRYVTALGTTDTPSGWRANKAFGGMLMDVQSNEMIADGLSMPHSPRWYRNKLWVLESGAGQLISIDEQTGDKTVVAEVPGFCRGFDFIERYALIGLSEVRETSVFAGLPLTEREQDRKCGVWVVDIESGETVAYLVFSGGVQEIFSVQVIPWKYPALLDLNDPLLRSSYSIPDSAIKEFTPPDAKQLRLEEAVRFHRHRQFEKAIAGYKELLSENSTNIVALYHLGVAYADTEQWDKAIENLNQVITLQTNHAEAHNSLGHAYAGKQETNKSIAAYEAAIAADNKYALAHYNRAHALLKKGNYLEGWREYEWRWKIPGAHQFRCRQPQWGGEDISDKILLIHTEQGNGDALQFARFLPLAKQRCKKLVVVCTEPIRLIFKNMDCVDDVRISSNLSADQFDVYCPIMSLAGVLKITLNNLPIQTPYIQISKQIIVPQLPENQRAKVGLVWAGSRTQANNHHRSCPLPEMLKLTDGVDYEFFSLQLPIAKEGKTLLKEKGVTDLEQELVSYAHTGALIEQMDMIVSVCTSVIHLAGALNKPAIALLSRHADWRWLNDASISTWYPSTQIVRQKTSDEGWDALIERTKVLLKKQLK